MSWTKTTIVSVADSTTTNSNPFFRLRMWWKCFGWMYVLEWEQFFVAFFNFDHFDRQDQRWRKKQPNLIFELEFSAVDLNMSD